MVQRMMLLCTLICSHQRISACEKVRLCEFLLTSAVRFQMWIKIRDSKKKKKTLDERFVRVAGVLLGALELIRA